MIKFFSILLTIWFVQTSVFAQSDSVEVWIDRIESQNGLVSFTGTVKSLTSTPAAYTYRMKTRNAGQQGTSSNTQSGAFRLAADSIVALSTVKFRSFNSEHISIELVILNSDREVGRAELKSGTEVKFRDTTTVLQKAPASLKSSKLPSSLAAAKKELERSSVTDALEIDGLLINETRTKLGRDFYGFFYKNWQPPEKAKNYTITFKEYPSRGRGARVGVEVNGILVHKPILQPRQDILEMAANEAIGIVKNHLLDQKRIKAQMDSEDQSGSGLF